MQPSWSGAKSVSVPRTHNLTKLSRSAYSLPSPYHPSPQRPKWSPRQFFREMLLTELAWEWNITAACKGNRPKKKHPRTTSRGNREIFLQGHFPGCQRKGPDSLPTTFLMEGGDSPSYALTNGSQSCLSNLLFPPKSYATAKWTSHPDSTLKTTGRKRWPRPRKVLSLLIGLQMDQAVNSLPSTLE